MITADVLEMKMVIYEIDQYTNAISLMMKVLGEGEQGEEAEMVEI